MKIPHYFVKGIIEKTLANYAYARMDILIILLIPIAIYVNTLVVKYKFIFILKINFFVKKIPILIEIKYNFTYYNYFKFLHSL